MYVYIYVYIYIVFLDISPMKFTKKKKQILGAFPSYSGGFPVKYGYPQL